MAHKSWSQEEEDFLRANWRSMSAVMIAQRFGVTKNVVCGKAHRLGLSVPMSPRTAKPPRAMGKPGRPRILHPRKVKEEGRIKLAYIPKADDVVGLNLTILELSRGQCRWPTIPCPDYKWRFCGQPEHGGGQYCLGHTAMSWLRQPVTEGESIAP